MMRVRITESELRRCGVPVPKARKRPAQPKVGYSPTACSVRWSIALEVPTRVRSESNSREHWAPRNRRKKEQWEALQVAFAAIPYSFRSGITASLPIVVTWTHIGRKMDRHDNLNRAFKGLADRLAFLLCLDDGDDGITWRYEQRPGKPGVELRIEKNPEG